MCSSDRVVKKGSCIFVPVAPGDSIQMALELRVLGFGFRSSYRYWYFNIRSKDKKVKGCNYTQFNCQLMPLRFEAD